MDSSIGLLQKVETIAYISGYFGLYVRIVVTFCKSQMAEQGKNPLQNSDSTCEYYK